MTSVKSGNLNQEVLESRESYNGVVEVFTSSGNINFFFKNNRLGVENLDAELEHNAYVRLKSFECENHTAVGVVKTEYGKKVIKPLISKNFSYGRFKSLNSTQDMFLDALLRDASEAPLVIAKGPAGTAKTFLSIMVGLHRTIDFPEDKMFERVLLLRPNVKDEDIGFLPGNEQEKIDPLMRPIYDNLERIFYDKYTSPVKRQGQIRYLLDSKILEAQSVGYQRGRSVYKTMIIVDEAQNLTPIQAKTLITRAGEGSKIVMVGDVEQIDHPQLSKHHNGLHYASETMKGSELCYQVTFECKDSVRSPLAREASERM